MQPKSPNSIAVQQHYARILEEQVLNIIKEIKGR